MNGAPPQLVPDNGAQEWKAHWPMVMAAMLGMSWNTVISYSFGTFFSPIEEAFGWSRATASLGLTITMVVATVGSPLVGLLLDRIGSRAIAMAGSLSLIGGFALVSTANGSVTQWVILWLAVGLGIVLTKSTVWGSGVSKAFSRSRGLALAAMLSGAALGQSLAPLAANALIEELGWRSAYRWLGVCWGGMTLLAVLLFYRESHVARTDTAPEPKVEAALPGLTAREAFRDSRVLRIGFSNLLMSIVGSAISLHLVPLIAETGVTRSQAVGIASTAGLAGLIAKFVSGWVLDRWSTSLVPFIAVGMAGVGQFIFLYHHSVAALTLAAMAIGCSSGATLQVSIYLITRYAGMRAFGAVFGTIASAMMLGTAMGPLMAGAIHDRFQSYDALLMLAMPTTVIAALLFVGLGSYPQFSKEEKTAAS